MSRLGTKFIVDDGPGEVVSQSIGNKALLPSAADDATIEVDSDTGKMQIKSSGPTASGGVKATHLDRDVLKQYAGSLSATAGVGGVFQIQNLTGVDLWVEDVILDVITGTVAAVTVDVGTAADAVTNGDDLIDGADLSAGASGDRIWLLRTTADRGANGKENIKWANNDYISASEASGAIAGLVGTYRVRVIHIG